MKQFLKTNSNNTLNINTNLSDDNIIAFQEANAIISALEKNKLSIVKNKHFNKKINFIIIFLLIFLLTLFILIFSFINNNNNNNNIFQGIYINNINVSNLSKQEAKNKVNEIIKLQKQKQILIKHLDFQGVFSAEQIGLNFNLDEAIESAYSIGHSKNIFNNNLDILKLKFKPHIVTLNPIIDKKSLSFIINEINHLLPDKLINPDYYINDKTSLVIMSGQNGVVINETLFEENIIKQFNNLDTINITLDLPVINVEKKPINIDEIYNKIYIAPINATYTTNPYSISPSQNGLDFNISLDKIKEILSIPQAEYIIPLKILYPDFSTNQINKEAFPDLLSEFTTYFYNSNINRTTNINLASKKINGTVLMPNDIFSFNNIVGKRTKQAGFKEASAYLNGKVIQDYGGGICQVSSTLYNAVLYANLEIIERTNHGFEPSYVKPGLDATVSWGNPDFKFKNNRNYPIKLITDSTGKKLKISIYGLKDPNDLTVKLETKFISSIPYKTIYQDDYSLSPNTSKIISYGSNGSKTATYKYLYDSNGNLISSKCISRDTYNPHNKIIAVSP